MDILKHIKEIIAPMGIIETSFWVYAASQTLATATTEYCTAPGEKSLMGGGKVLPFKLNSDDVLAITDLRVSTENTSGSYVRLDLFYDTKEVPTTIIDTFWGNPLNIRHYDPPLLFMGQGNVHATIRNAYTATLIIHTYIAGYKFKIRRTGVPLDASINK